MSALPPLRDDLGLGEGYHSPQVEVEVRLNTNESPFPPPEGFRAELLQALHEVSFHRYPDRPATELRSKLAVAEGDLSQHGGHRRSEVFCANGANEVLQSLLLAFGGPGRHALVFEPTYALHSHIARLTGTAVIRGVRDDDFLIDPDDARDMLDEFEPQITFLCSPNNPTGRAEPPDTVEAVLEAAPGMVIVDEAYGQFSPLVALRPALDAAQPQVAGRDPHLLQDVGHGRRPPRLPGGRPDGGRGLRDGRAAVPPLDPDAAGRCHRPATTGDEMEARVAAIAEERGRVAAGLVDLPVESWPSDANFILFRPEHKSADEVTWQRPWLLEHSVLIRNCADWDGLTGCLRVTIGTPEENDRFLTALAEALRASATKCTTVRPLCEPDG